MNVANPDIRPISESLKRRYTRIRRTKQILRPLPRRATLHRYPIIKFFAKTARKHPALWSFKISSVSPAIYAGCIIGLLPLYGIQVPLAFLAALGLRANLLVSTALVFITNPLTLWFIYPINYFVGKAMIDFWNLGEFESYIAAKAYPLILGGFSVGLITALVLDLIYRFTARRKRIKPINVNRMLKK